MVYVRVDPSRTLRPQLQLNYSLDMASDWEIRKLLPLELLGTGSVELRPSSERAGWVYSSGRAKGNLRRCIGSKRHA